MKQWLDDSFLLQSETAVNLYKKMAQKMPIFDYHNHLDAGEIEEDFCFPNLTEAWLAHDHYKWRLMRQSGVDEKLITGDGDPYEKFSAFMDSLRMSPGNPLVHWSCLELKQYFHIEDALNPDNRLTMWNEANALLQRKEYSIRNLLVQQNVKILCTTDDPLDSLEHHKNLALQEKRFQVLPSYRPDILLYPEREGFSEYLLRLENMTGMKIDTIIKLVDALEQRLDYFIEHGCVVSDHSLEEDFYEKATEAQATEILQKSRKKEEISLLEAAQYRTILLTRLGSLYTRKGIVMQLHIGAIRNVSAGLYHNIGVNAGGDAMTEEGCVQQLARLLKRMEQENALPKMVLYHLNPVFNEAIAVLCNSYSSDGYKGKIQWGPAWWFNDHKEGIKEQLKVYARQGGLGNHLGMLTDSRSYLSFSRHDYFRRILCNLLGEWVEAGEFPADEVLLNTIVQNICYQNAVEYFTIPERGIK